MRNTIVFLFCFVLFSCSKENEAELKCDYNEIICSAIDEHLLNKKKWINSNISSYSMNFSVSCYCPFLGPFLVTVNENSIDSSSGNEEWGNDNWPLTINDLFNEVERRIYEDPFSFEIKYDSKYGYPNDSSFDMVKMIADDEIEYYITDFLPL